jgi:hypothetical protein
LKGRRKNDEAATHVASECGLRKCKSRDRRGFGAEILGLKHPPIKGSLSSEEGGVRSVYSCQLPFAEVPQRCQEYRGTCRVAHGND